jgi:hypothetical protein
MKLDHDPGENVPAAYERQSEEGEDTEPALKRLNVKAPPVSGIRLSRPRVKRRRTLRFISVILIIMLIFVLVRLILSLSATDDQLLVRIGDQGTAIAIQREPVSLYATQDGTHQAVGLLFKLISKHEIKDTGQKPLSIILQRRDDATDGRRKTFESIKMRTGSLLGGVSQPCIKTPQ